MNLYVKDTPLWYHSPVGPPVEITFSYNSLSTGASNEPFGNKWQLNYCSYLLENSGGSITVVMPDGRKDIYSPNGSGGYITPYKTHNVLTKTASSHYELRLPDNSVYVYDIPAGTNSSKPLLVEKRDRHGLKLGFNYNTDSRLITITDALNRTTTLTYNADGLVTTATDPFGRQATFEYDTSRNLIRITDMGGYSSNLTYNAANQLITGIANARGSWQFLIEPGYPDYRITITNPLGLKEEYGQQAGPSYSPYPTSWHISPMNYAGGSVKTFYNVRPIASDPWDTWDITSLNLPGGGFVQYRYNSSGDITSRQYDGKTWQYTYNALGLPTTKTDPNGAVTTMTYDPANNRDLTAIKISNGKKTLGTEYRTYNSTHDVLSAKDRLGNTTYYTYNGYGQVASVTDALGIVTSYNYDGWQRLASISRAGQTLNQYTYDALDRVLTNTGPTGLTLTYAYNDLGQTTRITYPDGKFKSYQYSTCCPFIVDSVTERSGQTTFNSYDALNHLVAVTDPAGQATAFTYDANGNRSTITDANGNTTTFTYDSSNRLARKTFADGAYETYTYTGKTNLVATRTNARGVTTNYTYTSLEQPASYSDTNGPVTSFGYDVFGRLISITNPSGSLKYTYDNNSRLLSVAWPWSKGTVSYQYNALGRRTGMTRGKGQTVAYAYDNLNRLTGVNAGGQVYTYGYAGVNPLAQSLARPGGSATNYQYGLLNRLGQMTTAVAGDVINQYTYTYNDQDLRGMEDSIEPNPRVPYADELVNYTYNNVNELTRIDDPAAKPLSYDASGNLAQGYTPAGYPFTATYDSDNRLTSLSFTEAGGTVNKTQYVYLDKILLKKVNTRGRTTTETRYVFDGMLPLQERDARNNVIHEFTYGHGLPGGIGDLLKLYKGGASYSYLYDGKGNVTALLDGSGHVVQTYQYDPFGVPKAATGSLNQPMRFSTKPYDEQTGLSFYGYRFYAAALGRWLTRDPLGESGGINLYGFNANNPINFIDPNGKGPIAVSVCVALTLASAASTGNDLANLLDEIKDLANKRNELENKCMNFDLPADQLQDIQDQINDIDRQVRDKIRNFIKQQVIGQYGFNPVLAAFCAVAPSLPW